MMVQFQGHAAVGDSAVVEDGAVGGEAEFFVEDDDGDLGAEDAGFEAVGAGVIEGGEHEFFADALVAEMPGDGDAADLGGGAVGRIDADDAEGGDDYVVLQGHEVGGGGVVVVDFFGGGDALL